MLQQARTRLSLYHRATMASSREEARKILSEAVLVENLSTQWLDDTEQIKK